MSRYAVTYRIDGGPGLNGWAERTCNSVNVYANNDVEFQRLTELLDRTYAQLNKQMLDSLD